MASIIDNKNGKYRVIVCNGYKSDGKVNRISKTIQAKSLADAKKQANIIEADFKRNLLPIKQYDKEYTFIELVEKWRELEKVKLAITTQERDEAILNSFLIPKFGNRKISGIKVLEIEEYINSLKQDGIRLDKKEGGYSQKTIKHHYTILCKLFNLAVRWEILKENPCNKVDKPKVDETDASFYEEDQIEKLLFCLDRDIEEVEKKIANSRKYRYYYKPDEIEKSVAIRRLDCLMNKVYVWLALVGGFRRSEALGIEWSDVSFKDNVIKIVRSSHYSKKQGGIYCKPKLKNGSPSRIVTMPIKVMELLKEYKEMQDYCRKLMGSNWADSDRLFISIYEGKSTLPGSAMHPDTISTWFQRFLDKYRLPKITLHEVRHTCVSYLLNKGLDVQTVADRVGHRDCQVTQKIYNHIFTNNKKACADAFNDLL